MEEWRDIKGYEGLYQVSNFGRVKTLTKIIHSSKRSDFVVKEKVLSTRPNNRGYIMVGLHKEKHFKLALVHRLVAQAFIPNPNNLPQVNHLDENKNNNCVNNLEWCTNKENHNYGTGHIRTAQKQRKKVYQYDLNGNFIKEFEGVTQAEKELKIHNISQVCLGKYKQSKGFIFRYTKKELN